MKFYLISHGLWCVVETNQEPTPLAANASLAHNRVHEEEKLKKDKEITCLHFGSIALYSPEELF